MGLREFCFLVAADGADDGSAEMLCPLAQDRADAAGGRMQQDGVAGFDAISLADQVLHRQAFQHHRRRRLVVDAIGQLEQAIGGNQSRLGIGAERRGTVCNAIARLQISDAGSDFFDHARGLAAQAAWQLHRIKSGAIIDVDEVQSDRGVADARLPGTGLADAYFLPDEDIGSAGAVKADGVRHGTTSSGQVTKGIKAARRLECLQYVPNWRQGTPSGAIWLPRMSARYDR